MASLFLLLYSAFRFLRPPSYCIFFARNRVKKKKKTPQNGVPGTKLSLPLPHLRLHHSMHFSPPFTCLEQWRSPSLFYAPRLWKKRKKKKQLPRQSFFAVCNKSLRRRGGDVVCHVCCCCVVIEAEVIASFITRVSPPTVKSCFFGVPPRLVSMASLFRLFVCLFPSLGGEGWSSECLPSSARKGKATRQCRGVANGSLLFRLVVC